MDIYCVDIAHWFLQMQKSSYTLSGSSEEIPLGKWFIDRVSTSIPLGNDISVTARNAIGKLLKEQTFDERTSFTESTLSDNLKAILAYGEVEDYFVGDARAVGG